jgi:hypothetical protein
MRRVVVIPLKVMLRTGILVVVMLTACGRGRFDLLDDGDGGTPGDGAEVNPDGGVGGGSITYLKSSNSDPGDRFGRSVALSADGNFLAVAALYESSSATGVGGAESDNSASESGAVYVFARQGSSWVQQAYLKASNAETDDWFGTVVALSSDGAVLAVSAEKESSNAPGVDGNQADNSYPEAGAVYVFTRVGSVWIQDAYLKASNPGWSDYLGSSLVLSGDGRRLAVGSVIEESNATGINGDQTNNSMPGAGAVYVFAKPIGGQWAQEAYVKASNTSAPDQFGASLALSFDGSTLVVGARFEASSATGVDGNQADDSGFDAGAAYVFTRAGTTWSQQAYLKASNTDASDVFGFAVALSSDGNTLAVGAPGEDSSATGVGGNQVFNSKPDSGAVYVFIRDGVVWSQQAYLKASNTDAGDVFGDSVALSSDGDVLVVGADGEGSEAVGVGGDQALNTAVDAGAVYSFGRTGGLWSQRSYIKAPNTDAGDRFGMALAISGDASVLAVTAFLEDSFAMGLGADPADDNGLESGAAYVYE